MKKKDIMALALGLILGYCTQAFGQEISQSEHESNDKLENSLLWKISGKDLTAPSYVYGTMHVLCVDSFAFADKVMNALAKTEVLELEINYSDPEEIKFMQESMSSAEKLTESLDSNQLIIVSNFVKEHIGCDLKLVDNLSLSSLLLLAKSTVDGCYSPVSVENELTRIALEAKHKISGLESVREQLNILEESTSTEKSIEKMRHFENNDANFLKSQGLYLEEHITECAAMYVNTEDMTVQEIEQVVNKRNRNWMNKIPNQIQQEPTFIAVGTAHLVGEQGLITLLRIEGYTVEPVY